MILVYILTLVLGLCVGSFLNVVIYRVPNGQSINFPPSHCPKCQAKLRWFDNIPVVSWLVLGGKCRSCKSPISPQYIIVELLNMLLWLVAIMLFWKTSIVLAICFALACSVLIVISFIDLKHKWIPDRFQIILLLIGIVVTIFSPLGWHTHLIGFFVGGGVLLAFYGIGMLLFKREPLGIGDIKLMAVCGLILGWQGALLALFLGAIIGAVCCLIQRAVNKNGEVEFAFAPYLALGTVISMFFGQNIIGFYLSLFL